MRQVGHFIGGKNVAGTSGRTADIYQPMDGSVIGKVALASAAELDAAVRNAAEALAGTELFVDRSMLPDDGEEDEFYHADLIGLEVRDETGAIGRVVAVHNFGGGDILDVTLAGRKGVLIPFTQAAVPEVAITQGFVRVDAVAAGLVGDDDPDAPGRDEFKPEGRPRGPKDAGGNR